MAAQYRFLTTWLLDSPREPVWEAVFDQRSWPSWWRGVEDVVELDPGDENGVGSHSRLVWRSGPLPGRRQPPPTLTPQTNMVATHWRPSLIVGIGPAWPPGAYLLKLVATTGQRYVPLPSATTPAANTNCRSSCAFDSWSRKTAPS